MPRRPLPPYKTQWNKFTRLYRKVFSTALRELAERDKVSGDENAISEVLYVILRRVCFNMNRTLQVEVPTPVWEAPIPPVSEDERKGGKEIKRPDFTCNYINPFADSPEKYELSFHVECKLLGSPTSSSWVLNKNYVINGIKRFDCKSHQYGNRVSTGMMIGYIINMSPKEIETEVNRYQNNYLPGYPGIHFIFGAAALFQTEQPIERRNVCPAKFELIHLWVDIRK